MRILSTPRMERCIGCHAIYLDPSGEPFVCIHCGRCVEFCPHGCLEITEVPSPSIADEGREEVGP